MTKRTATLAVSGKTARRSAKCIQVKAALWAVKKPKSKSPPAFMPDEVAVRLEGSPGSTGLLIVSGWTTRPSEKWAKARLEANLDRLIREWAEEVGKGWILEIR